jgi:hypothetical protein
MEELLDPNVRKLEREKNFELVRDNFSMDQRGHDWAEVLKQIYDI